MDLEPIESIHLRQCEILERIAEALESINERQSGIANSLIEISDVYGSKCMSGPF